jgi:hypothetical protein
MPLLVFYILCLNVMYLYNVFFYIDCHPDDDDLSPKHIGECIRLLNQPKAQFQTQVTIKTLLRHVSVKIYVSEGRRYAEIKTNYQF